MTSSTTTQPSARDTAAALIGTSPVPSGGPMPNAGRAGNAVAPQPAPQPPSRERRFLENIVTQMQSRGASDSEIYNYLVHYQGVRPALLKVLNAPPDPDLKTEAPGVVSGVAMSALQGLSFGFGDEAVGAIYGTVSGRGAREGINLYREALDRFREEHGTLSTLGTIAGAVAIPGAAAVKGLQGLAGPGAGLLTRVGVAAGEGAVFGGLQAAGETQGDLGARLEGARTGAIVGGIAAPLLIGFGKAAGNLARPAIRKLTVGLRGLQARLPGIGTAEMQAREMLLRQLEAAGFGGPGGRQRLRALVQQRTAAGLPTTIADIVPETAALMEAAQKVRSPAKQRLVDALFQRQVEAGDRALGDVMTGIFRGARGGLRNAYEAADEVMRRAQVEAAPLYQEVYGRTVELTDRMRQILRHPLVRKAWEHGKGIADGEDLAGIGHGLKVPDLDDVLAGRVTSTGEVIGQGRALVRPSGDNLYNGRVPVRALDMMKRALDDLADPTNKEGISREAANTLNALLRGRKGVGRSTENGIITIASEMMPEYARARGIWQHGSEIRDAITLGRDFLRKAPEVLQRELRDLATDNARDGYRTGALQALAERVAESRGKAIDFSGRFFGGNVSQLENQMTRRLRALFPDPAIADDVIERIHHEARMFETLARAGKGSLTQPFNDMLEASTGGAGVLRGGVGATLRAGGVSLFGRAVARSQSGWTEEVSDAISDLFLRGLRDPGELEALLQTLGSRTLQAATAARLAGAAAIGQGAGAFVSQ